MKNLIYLFIGITLFSCSEVPQADVSGVIKEKRNRMLQKVSTGDIFLKAIELGKKSVVDNKAKLITRDNIENILPIEKEIFEMYFEASKENYKDNNIQYFDNKKGILYNEPFYDGEEFIGVYSVRMESAEVVRTMQNTKKPF